MTFMERDEGKHSLAFKEINNTSSKATSGVKMILEFNLTNVLRFSLINFLETTNQLETPRKCFPFPVLKFIH